MGLEPAKHHRVLSTAAGGGANTHLPEVLKQHREAGLHTFWYTVILFPVKRSMDSAPCSHEAWHDGMVASAAKLSPQGNQ